MMYSSVAQVPFKMNEQPSVDKITKMVIDSRKQDVKAVSFSGLSRFLSSNDRIAHNSDHTHSDTSVHRRFVEIIMMYYRKVLLLSSPAIQFVSTDNSGVFSSPL